MLLCWCFGLGILGKENLLSLLLKFLQESSHMKCDNIYLNFFQSMSNVILVTYYVDIVKTTQCHDEL